MIRKKRYRPVFNNPKNVPRVLRVANPRSNQRKKKEKEEKGTVYEVIINSTRITIITARPNNPSQLVELFSPPPLPPYFEDSIHGSFDRAASSIN